MRALNSHKASGLVAAVWICSLLLSLGVVGFLYVQREIEASNLTMLLGKLSDAYAPHLGAILAFYFTTRSTSLRSRQVPKPVLIIALAVSAVWNGTIVAMTVGIAASLTSAEEVGRLITEVPPKLSWLIAPALGYFFASAKPDTTTAK